MNATVGRICRKGRLEAWNERVSGWWSNRSNLFNIRDELVSGVQCSHCYKHHSSINAGSETYHGSEWDISTWAAAYDMIWDAVLMCNQNLAWISLIYRTDQHLKSGKIEKLHIQPFNDLWSRTTRVGRYQKKHSPRHSHPSWSRVRFEPERRSCSFLITGTPFRSFSAYSCKI